MTTATDSPLLALLGKGTTGAAKPALGAVEDERALDAALEFAALLLDAGGLEMDDGVALAGGNGLPGAAGKNLPPDVPAQLPVKDGDVLAEADLQSLVDGPLAEQAPAGVLGPIVNQPLPGTLADEIRSAQSQPAVLQRPVPANPLGDAAALAPVRSAAPESVRDTRHAATPGAARPEAPTPAVPATNADATGAKSTALALAGRAASALRSIDPARATRGEPPRVEALAGALAPLRDAAAATSQTASAVPQLAGPDLMPGADGWGRQFAERVGWVIQARLPQAQLTLNPEHLGPIEMAIEVDDTQARVQFNAAHAATREAIEQSLPRLREMLEQQGLELTQADVGADTGAGSAGGETADSEHGDGRGQPVNGTATEANETALDEPLVRMRARGLIDTFV